MSHATGSLRAGITALKQERYLEAIDLLESFCYCYSLQGSSRRRLREENCRVGPAECALAQVALVMAYQRSGDLERSAALCQELLEQAESNEACQWAKEWAAQALPALKQAVEHHIPPEELTHRLPTVQQLEECQALCSSRDPAPHLLKSTHS